MVESDECRALSRTGLLVCLATQLELSGQNLNIGTTIKDLRSGLFDALSEITGSVSPGMGSQDNNKTLRSTKSKLSGDGFFLRSDWKQVEMMPTRYSALPNPAKVLVECT